MTAPKTIPSAEAGYNGCSMNQRCFYEGSAREGLCRSETICMRDMEVRKAREANRFYRSEDDRSSARDLDTKECVLDPNVRCPIPCCVEGV